MCGISGLVWKDVMRPAGRGQLRAMNDMQRHRGPDDAGEYYDGPVALGHRRLSILDLSIAGHQPMECDEGRFVIVYNGEVYNYVEIREELTAIGIRFRSNCDTEVLLKAYQTWGPDCVSRFNGMWAFAIYDKTCGRVFISRDRFGIKPFYIVNDAERFAFASEIKGVLAPFSDLRVANDAFIHHFLPTGALDDGVETAFQAVQLLPPAHNGTYEIDTGKLRIWRYWDVEPEAFREKWVGGNPVDSLRQLLESAVRLHMRADVPVGTCLSGGVDSSTIVCLMSEFRDQPAHTFSGLYSDKGCNEEDYVTAVRQHTRCRGFDVRREPDGDLVDDMATMTWHQDTPTAGPGLYNQYNVMKRAACDVRVILDGQGADELFAGYLPYYLLRIRDLIATARPGAQIEAGVLAATLARFWGLQWLAGARRRLVSNAARTTAICHPSLVERSAGREISSGPAAKYNDRLSQTLFRHLVCGSIPALLHYEDRNSMAFSLEARVPLLDYRIVEFALGLSADFKIRHSWTKWILRAAMADRLPQKVAWRRSKLGYPTPAARWMRHGKDREALAELLFSKRFLDREIVTADSLNTYWQQHQSGKFDHSWLLYRYATTELWYRHYIDALLPKPAPSPVNLLSE
jgi:asparagine synthase (glutamine-hydrolysing)